MNFTYNHSVEQRLPVAAIDTDGDLHIMKGDGGTTCLTQAGPIFDFTEGEILDDGVEFDTLFYPGDTLTITF